MRDVFGDGPPRWSCSLWGRCHGHARPWLCLSQARREKLGFPDSVAGTSEDPCWLCGSVVSPSLVCPTFAHSLPSPFGRNVDTDEGGEGRPVQTSSNLTTTTRLDQERYGLRSRPFGTAPYSRRGRSSAGQAIEAGLQTRLSSSVLRPTPSALQQVLSAIHPLLGPRPWPTQPLVDTQLMAIYSLLAWRSPGAGILTTSRRPICNTEAAVVSLEALVLGVIQFRGGARLQILGPASPLGAAVQSSLGSFLLAGRRSLSGIRATSQGRVRCSKNIRTLPCLSSFVLDDNRNALGWDILDLPFIPLSSRLSPGPSSLSSTDSRLSTFSPSLTSRRLFSPSINALCLSSLTLPRRGI